MNHTLRFKKEDLISFVENYLSKLGASAEDAKIIADVFVAADLRGVDSHGLQRLVGYYSTKKFFNPVKQAKILCETPTTALIDGQNGSGQVISYNAMKLCIQKAKEFGMGSITVKNSNHFGIAGYYAMMALEQNMIGICMTNSQSWIVPTYGKKSVLGTNPISVAVPSLHEYPYVLDMATSAVSYGKVEIARKKNIEIPDGWAIDENGNTTENPNDIVPRKKGALLPLGGTEITSGYKGYGLAMLVEILCSALSGGVFSTEIGAPNSSEPAGVSHFFMAMKVNSFRPILEFKTQMDSMIQELKNSPKAGNNEQIFIAGEKEFNLEKYNNENGIPLIQTVYEEMITDGKRVGVDFDLKPIIN